MPNQEEIGRKEEPRRGCGTLYPERFVHDDCSEKEEQEAWWIFDHHQASQKFLAFGLILFMILV